jgi:glucose/arabinose dehydrogenase
VPVASGLVWPWDIAFLPDGKAFLVTEAPGRLRIVRDGVLNPAPVWLTPSPPGNDVLHGIVLHPRFAENRLVYVSYLKQGRPGRTLAITRGRLADDRLVETHEIFVADAWAEAAHNTAGRMAFGPDGKLYVSIGDRDRLWATDDERLRLGAQRLDNHAGKILRLTDDGSVPPDNPLVGRRGVKPEIFAYGFRNGYGLAFHPDSGELWQTDIGPLGGDEINLIEPGGNYGWPLVSTGRHYSGTPVGPGSGALPPIVRPVTVWDPAISPSSIAFYTGDVFPAWRGSLLVSALSGQQVQRLELDAAGQVRARESLVTGLGVRFRLVAEAPDGYLYLATELQYGTGEADGTILRLEPDR